MDAMTPDMLLAIAGLSLVGVLGLVLVLGAHEIPARQIFRVGYETTRKPLIQGRDAAMGLFRTIMGWVSAELAHETGREGAGPVDFAIGAGVYGVLTVLFGASELGIYALTFSAQGAGEITQGLPVDNAYLLAGSYIAASILLGSVVFDCLKVTHFGPYGKPHPVIRYSVLAVALAGCALSLDIGIMESGWRAESMEMDSELPATAQATAGGFELSGGDGVNLQPAAVPTARADAQGPGSHDSVPREGMQKLAALIVLAMLFAGWGALTTIKFAVFLIVVTASLLLPLAAGLAHALATGLEFFWETANAILGLFIALGAGILGLFGWQPSAVEQTKAVSPEAESPIGDAAYPPDARTDQPPVEIDPAAPSASDIGFNPFRARR